MGKRLIPHGQRPRSPGGKALAGGLLALCCLLAAVRLSAGPDLLFQTPPKAAGPDREHQVLPEGIFLGTFTVYAYCPCTLCCGQWSGGPTASGTMPEEGRTLAADWDVLPAGTEVYLAGIGWRTVEDTGSSITGDKMDLFMDGHEEALMFGVREVEVWK